MSKSTTPKQSLASLINNQKKKTSPHRRQTPPNPNPLQQKHRREVAQSLASTTLQFPRFSTCASMINSAAKILSTEKHITQEERENKAHRH